MLRNSDKTKISYYQQEFASRAEKKAEKTNSADSKHNTFHPWEKLPARLQKHMLTSFGGFHDLFHFSGTSKENSQTANEILLKRVFPSHKIPKDTADKKIDFAKEFKSAREQQKNSATYEEKARKKNITPRQEKLLICFKEGRLTDIQKENVTFTELFNVADGNEIPLICWAAKKGHQNILDYFYGELLKKAPANADIDHQIFWECPLFYWAAAFNQIDVIKTLLSTNKVQLNERFQYDETGLWIAAWMGNSQIVQLLIDYKADVDIANENGMSPLAAAATYDHFAVAECLLEHNAKVDTVSNKQSTPLMEASRSGGVALIELLLMHKAAINKTNHVNQHSLIYAAFRNNFGVVECLLRNGADPNIKDINNKTSFNHATCPHVKKLLVFAEIAVLPAPNSHADELLKELRTALVENNVEAILRLRDFARVLQKALDIAEKCEQNPSQVQAPRRN